MVESVILRVGNSSDAVSLGSAVAHSVYKGEVVTLRAIGAGAVNQAVKALAVASGFCAERGINLAFKPGFATISTPNRESTTAITFQVITY